MKKFRFLVLFTTLVFFTTVTFAQEIEEVKDVAKKVIQKKVPIKLSELPEAVAKKLSNDFSDYPTKKAYKVKNNSKDIFYIKLAKEDDDIVILIDVEGNIIKQKEKKIKQ